MGDLTAIDILVLPDETMTAHATSWNARLIQSVPDGFRLDANHTPHFTLLQRYVKTDHLDDVAAAVEASLAGLSVATLELSAVKIAHMELAAAPGVGLAGLLVKPSPALLDLQTQLITAIRPFTGEHGTADAYVTTDAEPDINQDTLDYVETYVPAHSGEHYLAHVTIGEGKLDDLKSFEAEPFEAFTFHPTGIAMFQLGNNGTARTELRHWPLP